MHTVYALEHLAYKNALKHIPTDENLFIQINKYKTWAAVLINSENNKIRLQIVKVQISKF